MNRTARLALNTASNQARMVVSLAVLAVLTPYIIKKIGTEDFGLWSLVINALGFLALLDMGFGTGVIKYVAECRATGDIEQRNRVLSTLGAVYLAVTVVACICLALLAIFFDRIFEVPPNARQKASTLLWILAIRFVILALPLSLFRNALYGEQKNYLLNIIQTVTTLAYSLGTWIALRRGLGVVAMAWVNLAAMLLEYLAYIWFAYATMDGLKLSARLIDKRFLKEAASFSSAQLLVNVAALILLRTDPLIVSVFFSLSAVAVYSIALKVAEQVYLLVKQFTNLLGPLAAQLKVSTDEIKIRFLFVNCAKYAMAPLVMLTVADYFFGGETLGFWLGPEFAPGGTILLVLLISMSFSMAELTASAVLSMTGHHRVIAKAAAAKAILNLGLSVLLAWWIGMIGVALGTLAATVLIDMFVTVRMACVIHHVTYASYFVRVFLPALLPAAAQFALTLALKQWLPPANLVWIVILTIPGAVLYLLLFWFFSIERSEKELLISKIFRRRRIATVANRRIEEVP